MHLFESDVNSQSQGVKQFVPFRFGEPVYSLDNPSGR